MVQWQPAGVVSPAEPQPLDPPMPKSRVRKLAPVPVRRRSPGGEARAEVTLIPRGQEFVDTPCCGRITLQDFFWHAHNSTDGMSGVL